MRKILYPLLGAFAFLFFSPSSAFAQIFRPPVPAAQAQSNDEQMNDAFNNDVAATGGAPQIPPSEDSDSTSGLPPTPEVTASFSQPSSADNLPPPDPVSPPQTIENQADAQQTYAQENQAQADAVRAQKAQEQADKAYAAQQKAITQGQLSSPPAQGSPEYTGSITGKNPALNPAANAAP